jgi:GTPase SAR1 family protein
MEHFLKLDDRLKEFLTTDLFPSIYSGRVILLLGAGASVTDRKYLGREVIDYYQDLLGINVDTNDLVEFVDIISSRPDFKREDFDIFISGLLAKLKPSDAHLKIASIDWCQIITTNLDLLLERSYDQLIGTSKQNKAFKVIRSAQEFYGTTSSDVIKYIKINGCIKDRNKYPFIFSSKDFEFARPYHKLVLKSLSDFTEDVKFMSIGYSYSDGFARAMLNHFDSFNYRYKRTLLNLDPFVPDARLDYLKENGITALKVTTQDFFTLYEDWVEKYSDALAKRKNIYFANKNSHLISLPKTLKLSLGNNLVQLSDDSRVPSSQPKLFYQGEKPSYDSVRKNLDVVKKQKLDDTKRRILSLASKVQSEKLIPVIFLTGYFGSGKSTFLYRVIHSLLHDSSFEGVAFEFYEASKIKTQDIGELFKLTEAKNIILTCQEIELDSLFKELMVFRTQLSAEQFSLFNIIFLVSIRENILTKYLRSYQYASIVDLNVDEKFNIGEAEELVLKLEEYQLVRLRDVRERKELAQRIITEYSGDSFVALFSILKNKNFESIVEDAYNQLSKKAKEAFVYTSILYQYKILMPSALLMRIVSKDWKAFEDEILKYDSKEILIQEKAEYRNGEPDLFFRTKHPIISQILVKRVVKNEDELFSYFRRLIPQLNDSDRSAELFVDLIKAIRNNNDLQKSKLDKLFDLADSIFVFNPHFTLHYAMNLQKRKNVTSIRKAIDKIILAEGKVEKRNHRLIHRRGVLNYELAKITLRQEREILKTSTYVHEARELFEIKRIEDPFSSYSYADYINLELWVLNNFKLEDRELLLLHIRIQELFDIASRAVYEDAERIIKLKAKYLAHLKTQEVANGQNLIQYLDEVYENEETRPFALVLKYNYLNERGETEEIQGVIDELELYDYIEEASLLLFKYYGRNLHKFTNRSKLFSIVKVNSNLTKRDPLRYHFYSYIAESYNKNFSFSFDHLRAISQLNVALNPELHEIWRDDDGVPVIFTGVIIKVNFFIQVRVSEMQRDFYLLKESVGKFRPSVNQKFKLNLHFFIKGIRAELIEKIAS